MKKINKVQWEGIKWRSLPNYNYMAIWENLRTIRFDVGELKELPLELSEFYDVSLGTRCSVGYEVEGKKGICPWCYVDSKPDGEYYDDICETWKKFMSLFVESEYNGTTFTNKPFQIACGSQGSPEEHPQFCEFLQTVYETGVVPNYTTNGVILSFWDKPKSKYYEKAKKILEYTAKYCGGVAVSFGNKALRKYAEEAIIGLQLHGDCHIIIHHLISDKASVDDFVKQWEDYGDAIRTHVLLPLMPAGRSKKGIEEGVFEYIEEVIRENKIENVAFGAHFINDLEKSQKIDTWHYPAETYSKNLLLKKDRVEITPSSFDLKPIKVITF